ncbi:MAG: hypothetical protein N2Z70_05925 [Bdellovibrionaceae bacterium]|jgi:hypothetical protein|nr:hypothetical protein [Pseudobdellovibrionaceae bacterium]
MRSFSLSQLLSLFILILSLQRSSWGAGMPTAIAEYKGYAEEASVKPLILKRAIVRFKETSSDFLIALDKQAAFYRFPKKPDSAEDVRRFLTKKQKEKKVLTFVVNPLSIKIIKISEVSGAE